MPHTAREELVEVLVVPGDVSGDLEGIDTGRRVVGALEAAHERTAHVRERVERVDRAGVDRAHSTSEIGDAASRPPCIGLCTQPVCQTT
ncbi:hypothetical protein CCE01nite_00020 [Cellulomonas cellasea]|uniref:Uncharacterized protein n=1 Tax=Cellulomonas cellasea TaxID=43670 RepID=A0A4Y3KQ54_9CELL|nr:hypothetical protein CCE01nite_00020 [Cellulomonas cellasea]